MPTLALPPDGFHVEVMKGQVAFDPKLLAENTTEIQETVSPVHPSKPHDLAPDSSPPRTAPRPTRPFAVPSSYYTPTKSNSWLPSSQKVTDWRSAVSSKQRDEFEAYTFVTAAALLQVNPPTTHASSTTALRSPSPISPSTIYRSTSGPSSSSPTAPPSVFSTKLAVDTMPAPSSPSPSPPKSALVSTVTTTAAPALPSAVGSLESLSPSPHSYQSDDMQRSFIESDSIYGLLFDKEKDPSPSRQAQLAAQVPHLSRMTAAVGTPLYMAPELISMAAQRARLTHTTYLANHPLGPSDLSSTLAAAITYDKAIDVYSFGILLWEIFMRESPYSEYSSTRAVMQAVVHGHRPRLPTNCPPPYVALMCDCWQGDPSARPSFDEIVQRLR